MRASRNSPIGNLRRCASVLSIRRASGVMMTFAWTLGPLYSGRRPPALELVARVVRMDYAADIPAPTEDRAGGEGVYREAGEHEFALTAAELGVVGTPVVGGRLRESLDHWHVRAFPSMGLADPTVPSGREPTAARGFPGGEVRRRAGFLSVASQPRQLVRGTGSRYATRCA